MKNSIWFSVIEWPDGSFGDEHHTEVSHFSSEDARKTKLKEYLEDIFEMSFDCLDDLFKEALSRGFKVWCAAAVIK